MLHHFSFPLFLPLYFSKWLRIESIWLPEDQILRLACSNLHFQGRRELGMRWRLVHRDRKSKVANLSGKTWGAAMHWRQRPKDMKSSDINQVDSRTHWATEQTAQELFKWARHWHLGEFSQRQQESRNLAGRPLDNSPMSCWKPTVYSNGRCGSLLRVFDDDGKTYD